MIFGFDWYYFFKVIIMMKSTSLSTDASEFFKTGEFEKPKEIPVTLESDEGGKCTSVCAMRCPRDRHFATTAVDDSPPVICVRILSEPDTERTPLLRSQDNSQYLGSDEPSSGQFGGQAKEPKKSRRSLIKILGDCCSSYKRWSTTLVKSRSILPMYGLLMVFSCHAIYMGLSNLSKCPWEEDLPTLLAGMGVASLAILITRIIYVLQRRYFPIVGILCARFFYTAGVLLFFILCFVEMVLFYRNDTYPTDDGSTYCSLYFYNYVRYTNLIIPVITIAMAIVHGPTSLWLTAPVPCLDRYED